ncbi:unnamed protein product [Owenia fusiformis]|uniref:Endoglucanase n=1 Tax=Owenia fusiformis TaxID=6347 RepID=A0A8J1UYR4_OWEFU|nr:unnamed protein product [Owenia fusiformis]
MPVEDSNFTSTETNGTIITMPPAMQYVAVTILVILMILGGIGNLLTVLVITLNRSFRKQMVYVLIGTQSFSDLILILLIIPIKVHTILMLDNPDRSFMMLRLATLVSLVAFASAGMSIMNSWPGGFQGWISVPVTKSHNGWTFTVTFSKPVRDLQIWEAEVVSNEDGGKKYTMKNTQHNAQLNSGSTLEMNFIANCDGDAPSGDAWMNGQGGEATTARPTAATSATRGTVGPTGNPPTRNPNGPKVTLKYDHNEVIRKSILFYEAQRSGKLPANNRIPYRGDSAMGDGSDVGRDLTGGWYDAGDMVKFGFPMAYTTTALAWGILEFEAGYKAAGEYDNALDSIKWPLDYFIKCHSKPGEEFYGQLGNGDIDHAWWGRPEDMNMPRPAYKVTRQKPGSDLTAETASAFAAGYLVFKDTNPTYAATLLTHARQLFDFANNYRGKYVDGIPEAKDFYDSHSGYLDELLWGAAWLYRATGENQYLKFAEDNYDAGTAHEFSWDSKLVGAQLILYQTTGDARYSAPVTSFVDPWLRGGSKLYTPKGLAWHSQWGANRYSANTAFIALVAAQAGLKPEAYSDFALSQVNYMLGDGGRSYVVGFGNNPPLRPHHASSSCPWRPAPCSWNDYNNPAPNPHTLYGALVGGPGQYDDYEDRRNDYVKNEVATDYNAGFQGALAGLKQMSL